jgi:hypothetical protein
MKIGYRNFYWYWFSLLCSIKLRGKTVNAAARTTHLSAGWPAIIIIDDATVVVSMTQWMACKHAMVINKKYTQKHVLYVMRTSYDTNTHSM